MSIKKTTLHLFSLCTLWLFTPIFALAQSNYVPLQPLPNVETSSVELYLTSMFTLLVGAATVLAVLFIVIGGIEYMSTDAWSGKTAGKEKIKNALLGLLLAGASWVILYSVNPDILTLDVLNPDNVQKTELNSASGERLATRSWSATVTTSVLVPTTNPDTQKMEFDTEFRSTVVYGLSKEECEQEVVRHRGVSSGCSPSTGDIPEGYVSTAEKELAREQQSRIVAETEADFEAVYGISFGAYNPYKDPGVSTYPAGESNMSRIRALINSELTKSGLPLDTYIAVVKQDNFPITEFTIPFKTLQQCEQFLAYEKIKNIKNKVQVSRSCQKNDQ